MSRWFAAYVFLVLVAATYAWLRPHNNWDMIPYVAFVLQTSGESDSVWHARVYSEIRAHVPAATYAELTDAENPYRYACSTSPIVLRSQLPFYAARVAYNAAIRGLIGLGLTPVESIRFLSVLPGVMLALLLWHLTALVQPPGKAFLFSTLMLYMCGLVDQMRWATPDALSSLVLLLSVKAILANRTFPVVWSLLFFSILLRPDNVLPALILLGLMAWMRRGQLSFAGPWFYLSSAALILGLVQLLQYSSSYDYSILIRHVFNERLINPGSDVLGDPLSAYAAALRHAVVRLATNPESLFIVLPLLGSIALFIRLRRSPAAGVWTLLVATIAPQILLRIVSYPSLEPRFFVFPALLFVLAISAEWAELFPQADVMRRRS